MSHLLFLTQQNTGGIVQWLSQNPFAVIMIITFVLLALASLFKSTSAEQEGPSVGTGDTPKSFAEVMGSTSTSQAKDEKVKPPAKKEPVKEEPEADETEDEPPVEEPPAPTKKQKGKKQKGKKGKKGKSKPEKTEEKPVAEEVPAEEPVEEKAPEKEEPSTEEVPTEEPVAEEAPAEEPAVEEEAPTEEPAEEKAPEKPAEKPAEKKPAKKDKADEQEEQERLDKLQKRQEKRTKHVSEVKFEDEKVEPRTLRDGLSNTRKGWISKLGDLLRGKKEIDDDVLEEIEEVLYSADIGTRTVQHLLQKIEDQLERDELESPEHVKEAIKDEIYKIINIEGKPLDFDSESPYVVMVVGVNGVGKTTSIGKIAARLSSQGNKVLVGAADTFRAAAVEQLELWAERTDAQVVKGQPNQDPSAVVFDAVQAGVARKMDIVLADTAGRLHTKQNLMEELKKIKRVMGRAHSTAPHEILLVLDATTGQNAVNQARQFNEALGVTGIVLTKLDGTSKGGVIVAICEELKVPIRYIGVGEHIDELKTFSASEFVEALFD
jgi:fused signal recognition particle receptor